MKIKKVICKDCGHEDRVEIVTAEEADRRKVRLVQVRCPKCGSINVILRD